MYSPAEVPSSTRAAPAKKRIWSTIGGISSDSTSAFGLPVFSLSTATSCSARASIASAIFNSASWRSGGVDLLLGGDRGRGEHLLGDGVDQLQFPPIERGRLSVDEIGQRLGHQLSFASSGCRANATDADASP